MGLPIHTWADEMFSRIAKAMDARLGWLYVKCEEAKFQVYVKEFDSENSKACNTTNSKEVGETELEVEDDPVNVGEVSRIDECINKRLGDVQVCMVNNDSGGAIMMHRECGNNSPIKGEYIRNTLVMEERSEPKTNEAQIVDLMEREAHSNGKTKLRRMGSHIHNSLDWNQSNTEDEVVGEGAIHSILNEVEEDIQCSDDLNQNEDIKTKEICKKGGIVFNEVDYDVLISSLMKRDKGKKEGR
ncbi:hypothetical protein PIB30_056276 [Stylosanthes scabra]|uniref:DUF4283 domain-containing protein n=1 Tax=Stylosanthes scabra TaxID=79078 RepID=A0ABU6UID8_9FABA|nr:hypothetical protein [Stylosanthes scabra]